VEQGGVSPEKNVRRRSSRRACMRDASFAVFVRRRTFGSAR
jgi:hypothetical protein